MQTFPKTLQTDELVGLASAALLDDNSAIPDKNEEKITSTAILRNTFFFNIKRGSLHQIQRSCPQSFLHFFLLVITCNGPR